MVWGKLFFNNELVAISKQTQVVYWEKKYEIFFLCEENMKSLNIIEISVFIQRKM